MNKFYFFLFIILVAIFGGIFYITQKDAIVGGLMKPAPTSAIPPDANSLKVISYAPQQNNKTSQNQQETNQTMPSFGVEEGIKASYSATISTSKGDIELTLFGQDAPKTVKNFITKAKTGFYKGLLFHRVEDWVVQGGDPKGDGTGGGVMQTEINSKPFVVGSLGVARRGDINVSNDSQFFITKSEASWLNSQYTNFGIVTAGMDLVNKIKVGDKILGIRIE